MALAAAAIAESSLLSLRWKEAQRLNEFESESIQCGMCSRPVWKLHVPKPAVGHGAQSGCSRRYSRISGNHDVPALSTTRLRKQRLQLRDLLLHSSGWQGLSKKVPGREIGDTANTKQVLEAGDAANAKQVGRYRSGPAVFICSSFHSMGFCWGDMKGSKVGPKIARAMGVEQARMGLVARQLQAVLQGEEKMPNQWDVVGLGQAMVDFSGVVGDEFLELLHLQKGSRKVVDLEERGRVLKELDGKSYKLRAGGSLSNTLGALAQLGAASRRLGAAPPLNVGIWGSVGGDAPGEFYRTKLKKAGVHFLSKPVSDGATGTVVVLTTPDAQRTMLAYQGTSSTIVFSDELKTAMSRTRVFVAEGYLLEIPETIDTVCQACMAAREAGAIVALSASDVSCVRRHFDDFWRVLRSADILFSNADEANALAGYAPSTPPIVAAKHLSRSVRLVSVTDGARGSYLAYKGNVVYIEPSQCTPVDTCGAGDAYAAGLLYAILRGRGAEMLLNAQFAPEEGTDSESIRDALHAAGRSCEGPVLGDTEVGKEELELLVSFGKVAAKVAAVVVAQQGARLKDMDAKSLVLAFGEMSCMEGRWVGGEGNMHPFGMGLGI